MSHTGTAGKMLGQILVTKQTGPEGKIVSKVRTYLSRPSFAFMCFCLNRDWLHGMLALGLLVCSPVSSFTPCRTCYTISLFLACLYVVSVPITFYTELLRTLQMFSVRVLQLSFTKY